MFSVRLFVFFFDSLTCYGSHSTARKHISAVISSVSIYIYIHSPSIHILFCHPLVEIC